MPGLERGERVGGRAAIALWLLVGAACGPGPGAEPADGGPADGGPAVVYDPVELRDPMTVARVWLTAYPEARCNDGTDAVFFFSPGMGEGVDRWILYLEGGGACTSVDDCRSRQVGDNARFMTSDGYRDELYTPYGILSANVDMNPDFASFNRVHVHYCSSDTWTGTAPASRERGGFQFRGRRIVEAVIDLLRRGDATGGRSLEDASMVILAGSSAGAIGVQNNLDEVGTRLARGTLLKGLIDAHWRPADLTRYGLPAPPEEPEAAIDALWEPQIDESCFTAMGGRSGCLGEALLPYLDHDVFVHIDQSDPNYNRYDGALRDAYKQAVRDALSGLRGCASPDLGNHGTITGTPFASMEINGMRYRRLIANWALDLAGSTCEITAPP